MYEEKEIEGFFGDSKYEFTEEKSNRALSVEIVEFFDHVTKQKRHVFVYSPYQELKKFGLKFENKKKGNINGYTISLTEENDKLYLEKELFFNKTEILKKIVREYDNKNVFFLNTEDKFFHLDLK